MATYITPPASFPADCLVEGAQLIRAGNLTDNRLVAGGLTIGAWAANATVGWPGAGPQRMDLVAEEEFQQVVEYRDALQAGLNAAPAAPEGTEALKLGDGTLIKLFGPMLLDLLMKLLAGRQSQGATADVTAAQ